MLSGVALCGDEAIGYAGSNFLPLGNGLRNT